MNAIPYEVDESVGGVEILEMLTWNVSDTRKSKFRIRYECCGTEAVIVRGTILRRETEGAKHCARCAATCRDSEEKRIRYRHKNMVEIAFGLMNQSILRYR